MLTQTFIKTLITKAQQLKPVVLIGTNGLTEQVHKEIESALAAHELIKIRVNAENRELRDEMCTAILAQHEATKIKQIGHVLAIYKSNPEKAKAAKKVKKIVQRAAAAKRRKLLPEKDKSKTLERPARPKRPYVRKKR